MAGLEETRGNQHFIGDVGEIHYKHTYSSYHHPPDDEFGIKLPPNTESSDLTNENVISEHTETIIAMVSLTVENLLAHPFLVLRRQCQVNSSLKNYHLFPITLLPVVYRLHKHQNCSVLWKGLGSVLIVRGLILGIEDLVSKITPLPKELTWYNPFKHFLLKCISFAIITPFYAASLVETVQSDVASDTPSVLDVFKEGFLRLLNWNGGSKGRMLPILTLVIPTVIFGVTRYFFSMTIKEMVIRMNRNHYKCEQKNTNPTNEACDIMKHNETNALLFSMIIADVVFYPFETIVNRLHLQGTSTIIDDLDTGNAVLPILTAYTGITDCLQCCIDNEKFLGLYKGFGCLVLQYTAHIVAIHVTHVLLNKAATLFKTHSTKRLPINNFKITSVAFLILSEDDTNRTYILEINIDSVLFKMINRSFCWLIILEDRAIKIIHVCVIRFINDDKNV